MQPHDLLPAKNPGVRQSNILYIAL